MLEVVFVSQTSALDFFGLKCLTRGWNRDRSDKAIFFYAVFNDILVIHFHYLHIILFTIKSYIIYGSVKLQSTCQVCKSVLARIQSSNPRSNHEKHIERLHKIEFKMIQASKAKQYKTSSSSSNCAVILTTAPTL